MDWNRPVDSSSRTSKLKWEVKYFLCLGRNILILEKY